MTTPELGAFLEQNRSAVLASIAKYLRARVVAGELRPDFNPHVGAQMLMGGLLVFFIANQGISVSAWKRRARAHGEGVVDQWLRGAWSEV